MEIGTMRMLLIIVDYLLPNSLQSILANPSTGTVCTTTQTMTRSPIPTLLSITSQCPLLPYIIRRL